MTNKITPFTDHHLEDAARLVSRRFWTRFYRPVPLPLMWRI